MSSQPYHRTFDVDIRTKAPSYVWTKRALPSYQEEIFGYAMLEHDGTYSEYDANKTFIGGGRPQGADIMSVQDILKRYCHGNYNRYWTQQDIDDAVEICSNAIDFLEGLGLIKGDMSGFTRSEDEETALPSCPVGHDLDSMLPDAMAESEEELDQGALLFRTMLDTHRAEKANQTGCTCSHLSAMHVILECLEDGDEDEGIIPVFGSDQLPDSLAYQTGAMADTTTMPLGRSARTETPGRSSRMRRVINRVGKLFSSKKSTAGKTITQNSTSTMPAQLGTEGATYEAPNDTTRFEMPASASHARELPGNSIRSELMPSRTFAELPVGPGAGASGASRNAPNLSQLFRSRTTRSRARHEPDA